MDFEKETLTFNNNHDQNATEISEQYMKIDGQLKGVKFFNKMGTSKRERSIRSCRNEIGYAMELEDGEYEN